MALALAATLVTGEALRASAQTDSQRTAQAGPPARLIGTVTDTLGLPLARAEIWLLQVAELRTISDDSGNFELPGLPSGNVTFGVRRLGFESATFSAVLKPGKTHRATFPLTPAVTPIPGIRVEEPKPSAWLGVFESRRASHRGTFITRKDFERRSPRLASDILRLVPGVAVQPTRTGTALVMTRGSGARRCIPQLYVHQQPYSGNFDDFSPEDIEAIEVYAGISEIPAELNTMGRPICGAVVVWTREPPPKQKKG